MTVFTYLRTSTDKQEIENQRFEMMEYSRELGLVIDEWIVLDGVSSRKNYSERKIDEVLRLKKGDILLVSELSRLARSTRQVLEVIETLGEKGVITYVKKQNLKLNGKNDISTIAILTSLSLAADIERTLCSERTKSALQRKKSEGVLLGTRNKSKDELERMNELAKVGWKNKVENTLNKIEFILNGFVEQGFTQRRMVDELNKMGIKSPRGSLWNQGTVSNYLKKLKMKKVSMEEIETF